MSSRKKVVLRDNIHAITKPAITRLARKAGIKSINSLSFEELRIVLKNYLTELLKNVLVFTHHRNATRVNGEDVRNALKITYSPIVQTDYGRVMRREIAHSPGGYKRPIQELLGRPFTRCHIKPGRKSSPTATREFKFKPGTQALRQIRYYQKQPSCFSISQAPFSRLVREIAQSVGLSEKVQFSDEALHLLQLAAENDLTDLLEDANLGLLHADRIRLLPKDIHIAQAIRDRTN